MKNNCWLCGGIREHNRFYEVALPDDRVIYFGQGTCLNGLLVQHVLDFEAKDKAMSERMNRHEAERNEESITISNDKGIPIQHKYNCFCDDCKYLDWSKR